MVLWPLDPNFPFLPPYPLIDRLPFLILSLTGLRRATALRFQSWSKLKDLSNLPWHLSLNFFEFFSMLLLQENGLILIRVLISNFYFLISIIKFCFQTILWFLTWIFSVRNFVRNGSKHFSFWLRVYYFRFRQQSRFFGRLRRF